MVNYIFSEQSVQILVENPSLSKLVQKKSTALSLKLQFYDILQPEAATVKSFTVVINTTVLYAIVFVIACIPNQCWHL